ncbi:MAG: hypothetical protein AAGJ87_14750, partial [Pseudomonadota bacterium]
MSASVDQIGDALVADDILPAEEWRRAQSLADQSNQSIRVVLDRLGLVAQEAWARAAATTLGLQFVDLEKLSDALITHEDLTLEFQLAHHVAVIAEDEKRLALAMADPTDSYVIQAVALATGKTVIACAAVERAIEARLRVADRRELTDAADAITEDVDLDQLKSRAGDAPVVRYVDDLMAEALKRGASDIHIEPYEQRVSARIRVDGV